MLNRTARHQMVAIALAMVTVVGVTAASAAGSLNARHASIAAGAPMQPQALPIVSGDLGEVVVHSPGDLGEVVVHAPGDLGEVLVSAARLPGAGQLMADVVVLASRLSAAPADQPVQAATMLAASL